MSIPFSHTNRPGWLKLDLTQGSVRIQGYEGKEVIVETGRGRGKLARTENRERSRQEAPPGSSPLVVIHEEQDNAVLLKPNAAGGAVDVNLQVPWNTSLQLHSVGDGSVRVEKVTGEIEIESLNNSILLNGVSGPVLANSVNGRISAQVDKLAEDRALSFSTLNGDIEVVLPAAIQARVKLEMENGSLQSDFKIVPDPETPPRTQKRISGTINGGGPAINLRTFNGSIRLRRQAQPRLIP